MALLRTLRRAFERARGEQGFTLVELMTVMVVLGIFAAGYNTVLSSTVRHSSVVTSESVLQTEVRAAVDSMAEEIRQAYTGDDATPPFETVTPTQLQFLSPDRATPFHVRRISYRINVHWLERAFATSTDTDGYPWVLPALGSYNKVVGSIQNTDVFSYFDADGNATTTLAAVRQVKIKLVVATNVSPTTLYTYQTSVDLRITGQ